MDEPILGKAHLHGYDYKPITWGAFLTLREYTQKVANEMSYPVYLVGSACYKELPRDIDISIILPLEDYERQFKDDPAVGKEPTSLLVLGYAISKSCNKFKSIIDLQFCIDYHIDIKICPDTWWLDKPKILLAEPEMG